MLTQTSYVLGLGAYTGAAVIALGLAYYAVFDKLSLVMRWVATGICSGLLLVPAYPNPESTTLAPALVVVIFQLLFGEGWSAAQTAGALLALAVLAGALIGLVIGLRKQPGRDRRRAS